MGKKQRNRSGLKDHNHVKKVLVAPMNSLPVPLTFKSWGGERLSEMLWAALILIQLPRHDAFRAFGAITSLGVDYRNFDSTSRSEEFDLSITGLSVNKEPLLEGVMAVVRDFSRSKNVLRPLLLLESLPEKTRWAAAIDEEPTEADWELLAEAIGSCLDHNSQAATDVRMVTVAFEAALGMIAVPAGPGGERTVDELCRYPNLSEEELCQVRPVIRCIEQGLRSSKYCKTKFTDEFWPEVFEKSNCLVLETVAPTSASGIQRDQFEMLRAALAQHYVHSLPGTAIEPRIDTIFGVALYGIRCLREMCETANIRTGIAGKALLRVLLEMRINLAYLIQSESDDLWLTYRKYGASQAKLALLKLDMVEGALPSSLSEVALESIANEDIYQEFLDIPLGSWSNEDLRKLSEKSGTKGDYDKFYGWASAFVHGQWGAIRDSEFTTCMNPLHRLHRVPRPQSRTFEDPLPDAVYLANAILSMVESVYPGMPLRFALQKI